MDEGRAMRAAQPEVLFTHPTPLVRKQTDHQITPACGAA